ncbi:uncharacterized protein PEZ65_002231 isoform 1-T2 [Lycodopsis pacificus]
MDITDHLLTSKEGQFVTVQNIFGKLNLCTVPRQGGEKNDLLVQIHTDDENQLAFSFKQPDGHYFPKVVSIKSVRQSGSQYKLQLEKIDNPTDLTKNHRFEKFDIKSSEHYGLRSVVEPKQYLHATRSKQIRVIDISERDSDCVAVTDVCISNKQVS